MTLTSAGAVGDGDGGRLTLCDCAERSGGTGLGNYTISYVNGSLTVEPAALTITANSASKTYGQTATLVGTEFTESGLVNGDTITGVTLISAGAVGDGDGGRLTVCDCAERQRGTGLGNYTISYVERRPGG